MIEDEIMGGMELRLRRLIEMSDQQARSMKNIRRNAANYPEQVQYLFRDKIYCHERVGNTLRIVRSIRALSQLDLNQKSGVDQSHISKIETGQSNISLDKLSEICESLDIRFSDFFLLIEAASEHIQSVPSLPDEDKLRIFRLLLKSEC